MKSVSTRMHQLDAQFFSKLGSKIAALQNAGLKVIHLDVGSPDLPPADFIVNVLKESASFPDHHGYQAHQGTKALRGAWALLYQREFGVELDAEREITPLLGSKEGIFHMINAFVDPGDVVLIPDPGYLTYDMATRFAGGLVYRLPLLPENHYLPDLQSIPGNILDRAKLLWMNYPSNPTSAVASQSFFAEVVEFAYRHDILICHDAAYTLVTYNGYKSPSILQIPGAKETAVEFNSLSKSHNMAGWRVGAALGNPEALKALFTLKTHADSSHFLPVLEAATIAMTGDQSWLVSRNEIYRQRRDLVIDHLHRMGLMAEIPKAAIYIWCPIPAGWTSERFAGCLLDELAISVTPGTVFGKYGEGFIRISITVSQEELEEAMERLAGWLAK
jgi:LL-diaminopimelate aminotransferase